MDSYACRPALRAAVVAWVGFASLGSAQAVPVSYVVSGIGTGSLDTSVFAATPFTLTSTADTDDIYSPRSMVYRVPNASLVVWIDGLGTATFTIPTITVSNWNYGGSAGLGAPVQDQGIVFVNDGRFASWRLQPSIGPFGGSSLSINSGARFATTGGELSFTAIDAATFGATVVPEPASAALLGLGGLALYGLRKGRCAA
jgi:hypothetical protein